MGAHITQKRLGTAIVVRDIGTGGVVIVIRRHGIRGKTFRPALKRMSAAEVPAVSNTRMASTGGLQQVPDALDEGLGEDPK